MQHKHNATAPSLHHTLLTGTPGCGKTTLVQRVAHSLTDLRVAGFYTTEIRARGQRAGFEIVGLSTPQRALLAHVRSHSPIRVGRYGVEPTTLVPIVQAELNTQEEVDIFIVDEIGKMELHCAAFVETMRQLLAGPIPVLATVALRGSGLIAEVKSLSGVQVIEVNTGNRDELPDLLSAWIRQRCSSE